MRIPSLALAAATLLAASANAACPTVQVGELTVGDKAPKIVVSDWIKGQPVNSMREDHVYVVEFWATWCPPCSKSVPHLTKLQKKYDSKVTVVGVSVWEDDPALVAPFVKKMGERMAYTVAVDLVSEEFPRGFMAANWMEAAGQGGIPAVFVLRGGVIQWIGSPFELDGPLEEIVAGEWDLERASAEARLARERDLKIRALYERYNKAKYAQDWAAAIAVIDAIVAVDPAIEVKYGGPKFEYLLRLGKYDPAYAYGEAFVAGAAWDHAGALNYVAWMIVDPEAKVEKKNLELALKAAVRADALTDNEEPAIIDTLAKVYFDLGKVDRAIELQRRAVKLARKKELRELQPELERRLEQYEEAGATEDI